MPIPARSKDQRIPEAERYADYTPCEVALKVSRNAQFIQCWLQILSSDKAALIIVSFSVRSPSWRTPTLPLPLPSRIFFCFFFLFFFWSRMKFRLLLRSRNPDVTFENSFRFHADFKRRLSLLLILDTRERCALTLTLTRDLL